MPGRGVKNAMVLIADVGSTTTADENELTQMVLGKLLQQPFLKPTKFEVGLVLVGTDGTDNQLNESLGDYEHVTVSQRLDAADSSELLNKIQKEVVASSSDGDYVDALIVALEMLEERCSNGKYTRTVAIVTPGKSPFSVEDDHINQIKDQLTDSELIFASLKSPDEEANAAKTPFEEFMASIGAQTHQIHGIGEADKVARPPPVAPTTVFRGAFEISDSFKIDVHAFNAVSAVTAPSLTKMSIPATEDDDTEIGKVKMERAYFSVEDPDHATPPEDHIKAYKYGAEYVPFNDSDVIAFKWKGDKGLKTLGFMPRARLKRDHYADKFVTHLLAVYGSLELTHGTLLMLVGVRNWYRGLAVRPLKNHLRF
mgnify:CR=1 FL=1